MSNLLDEIIDRLPNSHRYEGYISALCIFHQDTIPSLLIYPDHYYCLACGAKGRTTHLLAELEGHIILPSIKSLNPHLWNYLSEDFDIEDVVIEAQHRLQQNPDNLFYLTHDRKLSSKILKELGVGYLDGFFIFPIVGEHREVQGIVARAGSVTQELFNVRYLVPPHQPALLYFSNRELVNRSNTIYVTFGILDAITLSMLDLPAISGTLGHNIPVELFKDIRKQLVFLPDGDRADDKTVSKIVSQLGWRGKILKLDYPNDCKDVNEVFCRYGENELRSLIR